MFFILSTTICLFLIIVTLANYTFFKNKKLMRKNHLIRWNRTSAASCELGAPLLVLCFYTCSGFVLRPSFRVSLSLDLSLQIIQDMFYMSASIKIFAFLFLDVQMFVKVCFMTVSKKNKIMVFRLFLLFWSNLTKPVTSYIRQTGRLGLNSLKMCTGCKNWVSCPSLSG